MIRCDKCFSTQFENSRLSLPLYVLCMNSAWVSGSLTVGCFALERFRNISHRFPSIIPQQVWTMRQQHTEGTVISLLSHLTRRLRAKVFSFTVLLSNLAQSKPLAAKGGLERSFGACTSQWNYATIADPHCQKSTTRQKWGLPEEWSKQWREDNMHLVCAVLHVVGCTHWLEQRNVYSM